MRKVLALLGSAVILVNCGEPGAHAPSARGNDAEVSSAPDEVILVCADGDRQSVSGEHVRPRDDGVRVVVDNRRDYDPGMAFRLQAGGGGGRNAPPGRTAFSLDVPPGTLGLACYPRDPNAEPEYLGITVVDPDGMYTDAELDCGSVVSGIGEYAETPEGDADPEVAARAQLEFGIKEGDELRRAGYPESSQPVYVVVRNDEVVAKTTLVRGRVGWYAEGYSACSGFGT